MKPKFSICEAVSDSSFDDEIDAPVNVHRDDGGGAEPPTAEPHRALEATTSPRHIPLPRDSMPVQPSPRHQHFTSRLISMFDSFPPIDMTPLPSSSVYVALSFIMS